MRVFIVRGKTLLLGVAGILTGLALGLAAGAGLRWATPAATTPQKHPIYSVETENPQIAVGINCAWDNADIPALLELLEREEVRATFFVTGEWCERYPESVKAVFAAGHEVGSHSDTHTDLTTLSREEILGQIRRSCQKIQAVTGIPVRLFRTPSGAYNTQVVELIEQEGLYPIQWDCDSVDYKDPTVRQMRERIFKTLGKGSILLFHSGAKNTPGALPEIIRAIRAEGYGFALVGELIYPTPYTVDFAGRQRPAA